MRPRCGYRPNVFGDLPCSFCPSAPTMSNPALADLTAALSDLVVSEANSAQEQVPAIKEVQDTAEVCVLSRTDRRLISV